MAARVTMAAGIYRALLRLYPGQFQKEFAADMALDFADASDEAWERSGWVGMVAVWSRVAADLMSSLTLQWVRTGVPLLALLAMTGAVLSASAALQVTPKFPFAFQLAEADEELGVLIILAATVFLIIAATIIFSFCFLRPLLRKNRI